MLPRKWARSVIVLVVAGVLLIWAGAFASQGALVLAGIFCILPAVVLRYLFLRCPHCGKRTAAPQWRKSGTQYCGRCGNPFVYDDGAAEKTPR